MELLNKAEAPRWWRWFWWWCWLFAMMLITLAMLVPICITKPSSPTHPSPKCPTAGGDRRPNLGNTFIDSIQTHEKAILKKYRKVFENVFVLAALCISVLIIRIWSLSPCWPIPGCPVQSSQKSSDPQLFPRHTALRCGEITHYVQIQNMKYKKSTYSNPQQSNEQSTLEGPEQIEKIKCKDGLSLLPILCSVYDNVQNVENSTVCCTNSLGQRVDQRWCEAPDRTGQAGCLRLLFQEIGFPPNPSNP